MSLSVGPVYDAAEKIKACLENPGSTEGPTLFQILTGLALARSSEVVALQIPNLEKWGMWRTFGHPIQTSIPIALSKILRSTAGGVEIDSGDIKLEMVSRTYTASDIKERKWDIPLTDEEYQACASPFRLPIYFSATPPEGITDEILYERFMMHEIISQSPSPSEQDVHEVALQIEAAGSKFPISRFVRCSSIPDNGVATMMHPSFDLICQTYGVFEAIFRNIFCEPLDNATYLQRVGILIYTVAHSSPFWRGNDIIIDNLECAFYLARGLHPHWDTSAYSNALLHSPSKFLAFYESEELPSHLFTSSIV